MKIVLKDAKGTLVVANYNTDNQIVISGNKNCINNAENSFKSLSSRIRFIKLNVSGAFHSPLMKFAREALSNAINFINFKNANVPIFQNINAQPTIDASKIKKNLILQLENPVLWSQIINNMLKVTSINYFLECGPAAILSGLNRRISKEINTMSINNLKNINSLCV